MAGLFNPSNNKPSEPKKSGGLFNPSQTVTPIKSNTSGGGGLFNPSATINTPTVNPYDTTSVDKSISNAEMRIKSAGGSITADKRNKIERFLNLPEGQNWLFDTLDVIGRPQQALYSIAQGAIDNDPSPIHRGWEGFTGQNRITGSDFVRQAGIKNKAAQIGLGFATDVVADPTNLIPVGALAKIGKAGVKIVKSGVGAIENSIPALKALRETKVAPVIDAAKEGLGSVFKYQHGWDKTLRGTKDETLKNLYNQTENDIRYMSENSLRDVTGAARASGGVKTGDEVGRLMEKDLKQFEDVKGYEYPDGMTRTENKNDLVNAIGQNKSTITKVSKDIKTTNKEYQSAISEFGTALESTNKQISKLYFSLERNAGKELDAATRSNLRQARTEANRLDSQINNFSTVEGSMLREFKKQVRNDHEANFNIVKEIRRVAPNGIKSLGFELPDKLKSLNSVVGKGIDEVADELGYKSANDLIQDVRKLDGVPRMLSQADINEKALKEMERVGAKKHLEETLNGLKSARDTVRVSLNEVSKSIGDSSKAQGKAFAGLSVHPEYNSLNAQKETLQAQRDALRNESKQAQQSGVDKIRGLQGANDDLKQSLDNPVMIQKELQRPVRQYSTDPQVTRAADDLIKSNDTIRQWAVDNDIPVGEIDGYMRHILSIEEAALKKQKKPGFTDQTRSGMSNPDKKVLNSRTLMGSAEDINERLGRKHTETNAYFSSAVGQQKLIQYGNAVKFRREVLSNPNFAKKHKAGDTVDPSHELINTNNYKFIDNTTHSLPNEIGGDYVVTKGTKAALDRYQKLTSDVGINNFLKAIDTGMSWWKRGTLLSLPYHIRNDLGAKFNSYIAGMSLYDLGKYSALATKDVTKALTKGIETPLYNEFRKQGLGSSSQMAVEFAKHGDDPSKAITKIVTDQSKTLGGKTLDAINPLRIFDNSQKLGTFVDQMNRFAMYRWAREVKKMSPKDAAKIVTDTQFDYTKITKAEKEVFTRMMPFYRWARNNIPFQLRKFAENPARYTHINKLRLNAQDSFGLDDSNTTQYMKEQFQIPVTGDGKGKGKALGLNLPIGDLTKINNPLKLGSDMLNPFIKLGVELPNNVNLFKNSPIQKFEGEQKKFKVPDTLFGQKIPFGGKGLGGIDAKIAYAIEQLGGQPARAASNLFGIPTAQEKENKDIKPSLGIGTLFKDYDVNKTNLTQKKILLRKLMDQIDYLEQENGVRPKSVNDIKKGR